MKKTKYTRIVESKIRIAAFDYLKAKIKSKGKEINYGDNLKCQNYLLPNQILTVFLYFDCPRIKTIEHNIDIKE